MRFVSNIARAVKAIALAHILIMGGIVAAQAQQLPYGQWTEYPNTSLDAFAATSCQFAWAGTAYDPINHEFWHLSTGGHGCGSLSSKGDGYAVDVDTAIAGGQAWRMVEPGLPASPTMWPGYTGNNCFFTQSDGTLHPPEVHTYGGPLHLGNGRILFLGAFMQCVGTPDQVAALVDTTTTPFTWTQLPHLQAYAHTTSTALHGQYIYIIHRDGGWAKVDKDTLAIVASGQSAKVKRLGVELPGSFTFQSNASMGAGGINEDGFYCTRIDAAVTCSNINGTFVNSANNDSFGRNIRHNVPLECQYSGASMTPIPGGEFAMWGGDKRLCLFKPDTQPYNAASDGHVCTTAELQAECGRDGDTWRIINPPTGPNHDKIYNKLAWHDGLQALIGYGQGNLWAINPFEGSGPANTPPVANDDAFVGAEDTVLAGNVLTNDTDDNGPLSATLLTGECVIASDGTLTYTPAANFNGQVQCTYQVSDGEFTDEGTVTLTVAPVDDPAVVADEQFTVEEEGTLNGTVAANDSDIDSPLVYEFEPADGFTGNADGSFAYVGPLDFFGVLPVAYTANGIPGTLTITVTDVAEPMDRFTCTIDDFEFEAGNDPEEYPLVGRCRIERAEATPPPPPPPPTGESYSTASFAARSTGAIFSNGFDVEPPVGASSGHGTTVNTGNTNWVRPHRVTSADGQGALQFDMLSLSSSGASGNYVVILNPACVLGDTCHLQWRTWVNAAFINTAFERHDTTGLTSPKMLIFSSKSSSCEANEIVITTTMVTPRFPSMYSHCGDFASIPRLVNWVPPVETWVTFNLTVTKPLDGYQQGSRFFYDTHVKLEAKPDGGEVVTIIDRVQPIRAMNMPQDAAYWSNFANKKDYEQEHDDVIIRIDEVIYRKDQPIDWP